jgi:hypothetical protein
MKIYEDEKKTFTKNSDCFDANETIPDALESTFRLGESGNPIGEGNKETIQPVFSTPEAETLSAQSEINISTCKQDRWIPRSLGSESR